MKNKIIIIALLTMTLFLTSTQATAASGDLSQMSSSERSEYLRATTNGSIFVVNDAGGDGDANPGDEICETASGNSICTLRAAMEEADDDNDHDLIHFNLPNPSTIYTIDTQTTNPVTIDGSTNPGASCPTASSAGTLPVTISGRGITIYWGADDSVIRGLNFVDAPGPAISILGQNGVPGGAVNSIENVKIQCNHIGTDNLGSVGLGNDRGIYISSATRNLTIGGINPADRNVISGNFGNGIQIGATTLLAGRSVGSVSILGNYFGVGPDGTTLLGNSENGIWGYFSFPLLNDHDYMIIENNTMAYNGDSGISINEGTRNGQIFVEENNIFFNGASGVERRELADEDMILTLTENSIYGNGYLGIDKTEFGADLIEPNENTNAPVLTGLNGSQLNFTLDVDFDSGDQYVIEVFHNSQCDNTGYGEGETYVESFTLTPTSASGSYTRNLANSLPSNKFLAVTATNPDGETSEFSNCIDPFNTFTVNNNGDGSDANAGNGVCATLGGVCTLRAAIQEVNANSATDSFVIDFAIPGSSTITPLSALPPLANRVTIDGTTQGNATCEGPAGYPSLTVNLNGSLAGSNSIGLLLGSGSAGSVIKGLTIYNFGLDGLLVASNNNRIECNLIGQASVGGFGNGDDGIEITGDNNIVGGLEAWRANVLANNTGAGVEIGDDQIDGAEGNHVFGNFIGVVGASVPVGNGVGVEVNDSAENNIIGSTSKLSATTAYNVIGYNSGSGVIISGGVSNSVLGNYIGVAADESTKQGNGGHGVDASAPVTRIGLGLASSGYFVNVPNVIGDNSLSGIRIASNNSVVHGNAVGVSRDGQTTFGNSGQGLEITGSYVQIIDNVIGDNSQNGIWSLGDNVNIQGNFIGVPNDENGTEIGNDQTGILLDGDDATIQDNWIGANGFQGIDILAGQHEIFSNKIGLLIDGNTAAGNGANGIRVRSSFNTIGDETDKTKANVFAHNGHQGVYIHYGVTFTQVLGNEIRDNGRDGIMQQGSADSNHFFRNTIIGNGQLPIDINNDNIIIPNDPKDADTGSNDLMNRVIINSATASSGNIVFTFNGQPNLLHYVEFYTSSDCTGTGGYRSLGTLHNFMTNGNGDYSGTITESGFAASQGISAITTNFVSLVGPASSSEFSDCQPAAGTPPPAILQVNNPGDTIDSNGCTLSHCTLHEAITDANALNDFNTIQFKVGMTINIDDSNPLPEITNRVTIDGTLGSTGANCPNFSAPANLNVAIIGDYSVDYGLRFVDDGSANADGSIVRGLRISGFGEAGISSYFVDALAIECNVLGDDSSDLFNGNKHGIYIEGGSNSVIGGFSSSDRNVISGNTATGISFANRAKDATIIHNYIGTNDTAGACADNGFTGIYIGQSVSNITIGTNPTNGNVIACSYNSSGILVAWGSQTLAPVEITARFNSIYSNAGIGIDLRNDGVTANDPDDADTGVNGLLNYPTIDAADISGDMRGEYDGADGTYTIDVYANDYCHSSGYGEGQTWLDSFTVTVSINGSNPDGSWNETVSAPSGPYTYYTMTATDSQGNTSEFSECFFVGTVPASVTLSEQHVDGAAFSAEIHLGILLLASATMLVLRAKQGRLKMEG